MDKEIENVGTFCRYYKMAAKAPPVKINTWPKTDRPCLRLYIDYEEPMTGISYLDVVDSFTKWPEVVKYKGPTCKITVKILHEIFAKFDILDSIVSDYKT